jgi:uncharacterized protein YbbC (DUF1343 family)
VPIRFTPSERQYQGQDCGGVFLQITNRDRFEPIRLGLGLACTLRDLYPDNWESKGFLNFLADRQAYEGLLTGLEPARIEAIWREELEAFCRAREPYLLYEAD